MYNFSAIVDNNFRRFPDKVIVTQDGRDITSREMHQRVNAVAAGLQEQGIGRGDIVALLMNNRPEFLDVIFAVNRIGAAFLPLNSRLAPAEWAYILNHSEATAIVAESEFSDRIDEMRSTLPQLSSLILTEADEKTGWLTLPALMDEHAQAVVPIAEVEESDLHRLMYTSGTTSRPKGVPLTYRNFWWKNYCHIVEMGLTSEDSTLVVGPMYHTGALDIPALDTLHVGGRLVIMRKFDAEEVARTISVIKPTTAWMAPTMLNMMFQLENLSQFDLSSMRLLLIGGEKTPRSTVERIIATFPNAWVSDSYGLTETVAAHTFNDADHALSKAGSVGRCVMHHDVAVVDGAGRHLPPGELGEVAVRGPKVFSGYWKDADATRDAFRDGWFLTGDIGWLDEEGYLYIEDRKKDMVVSGGENIGTAEIESIIYEHPSVLEAAVVAAPHPRWGEVPMAFVVPKAGAELDVEDLRSLCLARLAKFKVPQTFKLVDTLPRNPSGKVRKRDLRDLARQLSSTGLVPALAPVAMAEKVSEVRL